MPQEFGVNLLYYGRHRKPKAEELGAKFQPDLNKFLAGLMQYFSFWGQRVIRTGGLRVQSVRLSSW